MVLGLIYQLKLIMSLIKVNLIYRCLLRRDHWILSRIKFTVLNSAYSALFLNSMIVRLDGLLFFSKNLSGPET